MTDGTSTASNDTLIRNFLGAWERRETEYIENGRIKAWREYFDLGPAKAAYDTP